MRSDGFDRMDVSTSLPDDPKFRALARRYPDKLAPAGWAYVSLLALSWREAGRLSLDEGWPFGLPWDQEAADALLAVGLVDEEYRLPLANVDDSDANDNTVPTRSAAGPASSQTVRVDSQARQTVRQSVSQVQRRTNDGPALDLRTTLLTRRGRTDPRSFRTRDLVASVAVTSVPPTTVHVSDAGGSSTSSTPTTTR